MPLPHSVYRDACKKRVLRRRQPVCKRLDTAFTKIDVSIKKRPSRFYLILQLGSGRICTGQDVAFFLLSNRICFHRVKDWDLRRTAQAFIHLIQLFLQFSRLFLDVVGKDRIDLATIDSKNGKVVVSDLLLFDATLFFGLQNHGAHIGREHCNAFVVETLLVGSEQISSFFLQRRACLFSFRPDFAGFHQRSCICERHLAQDEGIEQRFHGVIINFRNRVEHVVVTFGARNCHAHEGGRNGVDSVDGEILGIFSFTSPSSEKTQCKHVTGTRFPFRAVAGCRHTGTFAGTSSCQLNLHEIIVRKIFVQGVDDPVSPKMNSRSCCHS